jgi:hypothetical protein
MQNSVAKKHSQQDKKPSTTPPMFRRKIGSTIYTVSVHSSQTSKETIEDKLLRLIKNGVCNSA